MEIHKVLLLSLLSAAASGQSIQQGSIRFDAISIKENTTGGDKGYVVVPENGDRLIVRNSPMFRIIGFAFHKKRNDLIEGLPDWTHSARWDLEVVVAPESLLAFHSLSFDQQCALLQEVLAIRCRLSAHEGTKEVPVYALIVSKVGLKAKEVPPLDSKTAPAIGYDLTQSAGEIHAHAISISGLVYALTKIGLSRPIVDKTGIKGQFDINLSFNPDEASADFSNDNGATGRERPSIFTEIQERLGLKLEATRANVPAVFVSHIDKPAAN